VPSTVFAVFFGVWILLGVSGFLLFYAGRDAAFKRQFFPLYLGVAAVVFIGFTAGMGAPLSVLAIMIPFVAFVMLLNYRGTRFCDSCGRTLIDRAVFSRPKFCPQCGAALDGSSGPPVH
jgi:hypothetical protein